MNSPVSGGAAVLAPAVRPLAHPGDAAPRHRFPLWHLAGRSVGVLMNALPRRWRFGAAVRVSIALRPLIRRTAAYREQRKQRMDTVREISLYRLLESITASGATFDPVLRLEGMEHLEAAMAEGRGVLLVSPHAMLGTLVLRMIHDFGWPQTVIAGFPVLRFSGSRDELRTLRPSPTFLIHVRSRLREGGLVAAMLDRIEEEERRTLRFATARGTVQVADALIPLGLRCGARIVFLAARMEGTEVVARFATPSRAAQTADAVTGEFVAWVQAHVASHEGAGDAAPPRPASEAPAVDVPVSRVA